MEPCESENADAISATAQRSQTVASYPASTRGLAVLRVVFIPLRRALMTVAIGLGFAPISIAPDLPETPASLRDLPRLMESGSLEDRKEFVRAFAGCWGAFGIPINCAETGQDGKYQSGASVSPRFNDNGDGTVKDNLTGLIRLKDPACLGLRNWTDALLAANALSAAGSKNSGPTGRRRKG